jgi:HK97 family phage major capsid protein
MSDQDTTTTTTRTYSELAASYNDAAENVQRINDAIETAKHDPETTDQARSELLVELTGAIDQAERLKEELESKQARARAVERYKRLDVGSYNGMQIREPDIYEAGNGMSFFTDLFRSKQSDDYRAAQRLERHQRHEADKRPGYEERAVTSGTVGGLIPPAYLLDLYAKASRNGRVYADQANGQQLPDVGMNVILPRITTATSADVQATENTTVATQDPAETDLTVPVRTIAGFLPVSRQALERGAYTDAVLFEDLIARYWARLDVQCLNGSGSSGQILGLFNTSSTITSTSSTATVAGVWPKIADVIQQVNTAMGGIGYVPDKIIMHPRRWGFFEAALDTTNRPLFDSYGNADITVVGTGAASGYAGPVGRMHGLPVYTDANIPTNFGAGTNEDRIIVQASPVVHLFERNQDPVTLSFEQQAGTSLQVQLIVFGYAVFTAGRYPSASGWVQGAGLVPPTF